MEVTGTGSSPVFVDASGRRLRRWHIASRLAGIAAFGYFALTVASLVGAPGIARLHLPGLAEAGPAAPAVQFTGPAGASSVAAHRGGHRPGPLASPAPTGSGPQSSQAPGAGASATPRPSANPSPRPSAPRRTPTPAPTHGSASPRPHPTQARGSGKPSVKPHPTPTHGRGKSTLL